jgi:hypothetical protein
MTNRLSRRAIACALFASTSLSLPSLASAATPGPKFLDVVDDHGVDLATGLPFLAIEEGGLGSGPARVAMQRVYAEGAGFVDNWSGGLYNVTANGVTKKYVQFAGISDTFSGSGTSWTSDKADGATLTANADGTYTYIAGDGTSVLFDALANGIVANQSFNCPGADASTCQAPISITRPNGLKFDFGWETTFVCVGGSCFYYKRLQTVESSAAFQLSISYATLERRSTARSIPIGSSERRSSSACPGIRSLRPWTIPIRARTSSRSAIPPAAPGCSPWIRAGG